MEAKTLKYTALNFRRVSKKKYAKIMRISRFSISRVEYYRRDYLLMKQDPLAWFLLHFQMEEYSIIRKIINEVSQLR